MLTVLMIVGLAAALYGVQWIIAKGVDTADRTIRHKTLDAGRREASAGLALVAPVRASDLVQKIVQTVNAHASEPAVVVGLHLRSQGAMEAVFAFGSKMHGDAFVAEVALANVEGGCRGEFSVLAWTESGAEVAGRKEMTRLRTRIQTAVQTVSGTATET